MRQSGLLQKRHFVAKNLRVHLCPVLVAHSRVDQNTASVGHTDGSVKVREYFNARHGIVDCDGGGGELLIEIEVGRKIRLASRRLFMCVGKRHAANFPKIEQ